MGLLEGVQGAHMDGEWVIQNIRGLQISERREVLRHWMESCFEIQITAPEMLELLICGRTDG
jgi:hypothetical protein